MDDIGTILAKALANGAELIMPKEAIPGVGYQAYIRDNCGNVVGLHQADPKAGL